MQTTGRVWGSKSSTPSSPQSPPWQNTLMKISIFILCIYSMRSSFEHATCPLWSKSHFKTVTKKTNQRPESHFPKFVSCCHQQGACAGVEGCWEDTILHHFGYFVLSQSHVLKRRAVSVWSVDFIYMNILTKRQRQMTIEFKITGTKSKKKHRLYCQQKTIEPYCLSSSSSFTFLVGS